jgi:hypothetical protein
MNPYLDTNPDRFVLSRKIVKKHRDHVEKHAAQQEKAFDEVLLKLNEENHKNNNNSTMTNNNNIILDGAIQQQIFKLLSSPSVERDIFTPNPTGSSQRPNTTSRSRSATGGRTLKLNTNTTPADQGQTQNESKSKLNNNTAESTSSIPKSADSSSEEHKRPKSATISTTSEDPLQGSSLRAAQALNKRSVGGSTQNMKPLSSSENILSSTRPQSVPEDYEDVDEEEDRNNVISASSYRESSNRINSAHFKNLESNIQKLREELVVAKQKAADAEKAMFCYDSCYYILIPIFYYF